MFSFFFLAMYLGVKCQMVVLFLVFWGTSILFSTNLHWWNTTIVGEDVEKGEPVYTVGRRVNWWKITWRFLRKWKIELPYYIPLLGTYPKKENTNLKNYMHFSVHSNILIIAKVWKQPKCPSVDEWIEKMWCVFW